MGKKLKSAKSFMEGKNKDWKDKQEKGKTIPMKDIGGKGKHHFHKEAWTFMPQSNLADNKVFVIERLKRMSITGEARHQHAKKGDIEYRIGYYIIGANGNKRDKWAWGQFCPLIPIDDLAPLLQKARKEGTIL